MNQAEEIRQSVSASYARAVESPRPGGCCGAGAATDAAKGVAFQSAGYRPEELAELPENAVENAFGCGNPVAFLGVREGDVVLDLGSGAGIDLLLAARKVGPTGRVIGVDMTDAMIARARANAAAAGLANVEVRKGLIEALPVADSSVDWVISNCVINLSPEKERVFAEIARVLKPGGRMVVSDIVVDDLPAEIRANAVAYNACLGGAVSEDDYRRGLEAAGLAEVEVAERLVYDAPQIAALVESEIEPAAAGCGCCGEASVGELVARYAPAVAGKVWSARFTATKGA
jgi:arsenite methyltransferase